MLYLGPTREINFRLQKEVTFKIQGVRKLCVKSYWLQYRLAMIVDFNVLNYTTEFRAQSHSKVRKDSRRSDKRKVTEKN